MNYTSMVLHWAGAGRRKQSGPNREPTGIERARVTNNPVYPAYAQKGQRPSRSWHSAVAAAVAVLVLPSVAWSRAGPSCPSGPKYSIVRYDDDFSYLRDPACRNDFWDPLKYIPLNA